MFKYCFAYFIVFFFWVTFYVVGLRFMFVFVLLSLSSPVHVRKFLVLIVSMGVVVSFKNLVVFFVHNFKTS